MCQGWGIPRVCPLRGEVGMRGGTLWGRGWEGEQCLRNRQTDRQTDRQTIHSLLIKLLIPGSLSCLFSPVGKPNLTINSHYYSANYHFPDLITINIFSLSKCPHSSSLSFYHYYSKNPTALIEVIRICVLAALWIYHIAQWSYLKFQGKSVCVCVCVCP